MGFILRFWVCVRGGRVCNVQNHRAKPLADVIRQAKYAVDAKMTPFGRYIMTVEVKQWRKQLSYNEILKELAVSVNAIEEELAASCLEVRSSASSCT